MAAITPNQLTLLQAQLSAARACVLETHKTVSNGRARGDEAILPFLQTCAEDLEQTAQLLRSAAVATAPKPLSGCST